MTDTAGCLATAHAYIANPDGPNGFITEVIDATCDDANGSATVTRVTGNSPFTFTWDTSPPQHTATASGLDENIYYVMITDANSCVSFLHVKINRTPKALLSLSTTEDASCSHGDGSAEVQASGGIGPYQFLWNTNPVQFSNRAMNLYAGSYAVMLIDGNSCRDTLNVIIGEKKAINSLSYIPACTENPVYFSAQTNYTGNATWYWDFGDGSSTVKYNELTADHLYPDTSWYTVTLYIDGGCATDTLIQTVKGSYKPAASFVAGSDHAFASAPVQFLYTGTNVNAYSWDFGDGNGSSEASPYHIFDTPYDSQLVILYVEDEFGCKDTAAIKLFIDVPPAVYVPNSFTPNGDGLNDCFNISSTGLKESTLRIFDRWGEQVFICTQRGGEISKGWDGNVHGSPAPEGSYTYLLDAHLENNEIAQYKGVLTLIY